MDRPIKPANPDSETLDGRAGGLPHADMPATGRQARVAVSEGPGSRVGRYKLIQKLGEGGFGVVFQAEQERPVRRTVALKIIKLGMDTHAVIARFDGERQALAMMDHPNIAKVLDAGTTENGRPYFVMEFVQGVAITEYCDAKELSTKDRLALFNAVCLAVQHAHQKGIIHRDLKPSNILVTLQDGKPVPKVIDFGIAKATSGRLTDMTLQTELHEMIGTPQYMSPEQAEMATLDIDTRTDIYSLGVVLFELLTGGTPLNVQTLRTASLLEMQRMIREAEAPRPSAKLASMGKGAVMIAIHRKTDVKRLSQQLRGELDWIVLKAMEKDRTRRYDTAQGLALDVQRYLNDEPVLARPASAMYRTQKFVRKHKAAVITAAVVVLALVLGIAGTTVGMAKARRASATAIAAEKVATEEKDQVVGLLSQVKNQQGKIEQGRLQAERARLLAEKSAESAKTEARNARIGEARSLIHQADAMAVNERVSEASALYARGRKELDELGLSLTPADLGQWELTRRSPPSLWVNHTQAKGTSDIEGVALTPDQKTVLAMAGNGHVDVWDLRRGSHIRGFETPGVGWANGAFSVSPDGRLLVMSRGTDKSIHLVNVENGVELHNLTPLKKAVYTAGFSRDGRRLFAATGYGELGIYDPASGQQLKVITGHGQFYPDPDGRRAVLLVAGGAELWDLQTAKMIRGISAPLMQSGGSRVAISNDGRTALFGDSSSGVVWCWKDVDKDDGLVDFSGRHSTGVSAMTLSRDGLTLLTVGTEGDVKLWDVAGQRLRRTIGRCGQAISLAQSDDGAIAVTGDWSAHVNLWSLKPGRESRVINVPETTMGAVAIFPGARVGVSAGWDSKFRFHDLLTGKLLRIFDDPERKAKVKRLFITERATRLLAAESLGGDTSRIDQLTLWDIDRGTIVSRVPLKVSMREVVLSPSGHVLLGQERDEDWDRLGGSIRAWDVASLRELSLDAAAALCPDISQLIQRMSLPNAALPLAISPDGAYFASATAARYHGCYWDPDLTIFAMADRNDRGVNWDPSRGSGFYDAAVSPDGRLFAAAAGDSLVKLFDPVARQEIVSLAGHAGTVKAVAFPPDAASQMILSAGNDRTLRVWDLGRTERYAEFKKRVNDAQRRLEIDGGDASALRELGEWYAFRGEWAWAIDLLTAARQKAQPVSPLLMARCDWMLGDLPGAEREFLAAIARDEAAVDYLKQCLAAVRREMTQTAEWRAKVDEAIKLPEKTRLAAISELLKQNPYDSDSHARRAILLCEDGQFDQAGADFDLALELQENTDWRYRRACVRLYLGDQKQYLQDAQVMYARSISAEDHHLSNEACKTCLLQPGAAPDVGRIAEMIDRHIRAPNANFNYGWDMLNMGLAQYRLGQFDPAIVWLDKAKQSTIAYPATITAELFEAMANFQAGRKQLGKDQLAACVQRIETDPLKAAAGDIGGFDNWLICQIALREAKTVIR